MRKRSATIKSLRFILCLATMFWVAAIGSAPSFSFTADNWNLAAAGSETELLIEDRSAFSSWQWEPPQEMNLSAVKIRSQSAWVPLDPVRSARLLLALPSAPFDRMQLAASYLVLSGLKNGRHWIALLKAEGKSTHVLVSSLIAQPSSRSFDPDSLVPAGSRRVLDVHTRKQGGSSLSSYACSCTAEELRQQLNARLRQANWQPDLQASLNQRSQEWIHADSARLSVFIEEKPIGASLVFWYRKRQTP